MEQRTQVRKAAELGVVVSCPQFGLFRGQIDNLCMQGIFVRTQNVAICLNAPVTVTFQPDPSQPLQHCNAAGVVVHQTDGGIGIRFSDLDANCLETLQRLYSRMPEARRGMPGPQLLAV
jgi:hypothetical protein